MLYGNQHLKWSQKHVIPEHMRMTIMQQMESHFQDREIPTFREFLRHLRTSWDSCSTGSNSLNAFLFCKENSEKHNSFTSCAPSVIIETLLFTTEQSLDELSDSVPCHAQKPQVAFLPSVDLQIQDGVSSSEQSSSQQLCLPKNWDGLINSALIQLNPVICLH